MPHRIVAMDSIPLTTAGKADRGALKKMLHSHTLGIISSSTSVDVGLLIRHTLEDVLGTLSGERFVLGKWRELSDGCASGSSDFIVVRR